MTAGISYGGGGAIYTGQSAAGNLVTALVLSDGTYWFLYAPPSGSTNIDGIYHGVGKAANGRFTSALTYSYLPGQNSEQGGIGTLSATDGNGSFDGQLTTSISNSSFTTTLSPISNASASLSQLAGAYNNFISSTLYIEAAGIYYFQPMNMTIASNGAITGKLESAYYTNSGHIYRSATGTVTPRSDVNAFDVTISFSGTWQDGATAVDGLTYNGVGYFNAATRTFTFAAVTPDSSWALAFGAVSGQPLPTILGPIQPSPSLLRSLF